MLGKNQKGKLKFFKSEKDITQSIFLVISFCETIKIIASEVIGIIHGP